MHRCTLFAALLTIAACGDNASVDLPPELGSARLMISVAEGGTTTVDVAAVDPEGGLLTYTPSQPAHGTVTGTGPVFVYQAAAGYSGADSFRVAVANGVGSVVLTVDVAISHVNAPPVAAEQQVVTTENHGVAITLSAADPDSATLSYAIDAPPAHGALTGTPPALTYTPAAQYYGADSFTFEASDGALISNVATVAISITHVACPSARAGELVDSAGCSAR